MIGSNEYKNNTTSNKCQFLKINSISLTHDSTIVNLCISAAFVARVIVNIDYALKCSSHIDLVE
ncbi:20086_t:CDS:2, partial [Entrophospora sp. SA101]